VKWTDERSGSFLSDHHGRAQDMVMEMAFDENAHILAIRLTGYGNMGGYLAQFGPLLPTGNQVKNIASIYRTPLIEVATKCVFTNTNFVSAYRGAGRPEGNYYIERTLDLAASELGIDRIDLRKRNMIRKSDLPFKAASDMTYDCGETMQVSTNAGAKAASAACCAASASGVISKSPPLPARNLARSISKPTARSLSLLARSTSAWVTRRLMRKY
jgi:carbon-monoxide dehydrogenase large subunit